MYISSSPDASTYKSNKNKYTYTKHYKKHSTNNTKHSKYKYTFYQNTDTLQNPHIHTLQNKLKQPQYKLKRTHYKVYPIEVVTIQSSTLSIRSP